MVMMGSNHEGPTRFLRMERRSEGGRSWPQFGKKVTPPLMKGPNNGCVWKSAGSTRSSSRGVPEGTGNTPPSRVRARGAENSLRERPPSGGTNLLGRGTFALSREPLHQPQREPNPPVHPRRSCTGCGECDITCPDFTCFRVGEGKKTPKTGRTGLVLSRDRLPVLQGVSSGATYICKFGALVPAKERRNRDMGDKITVKATSFLK